MRYLRFKELQQRNIVRNWTTLTRLLREQGFPAGVRLGAQARAWEEAEVEAWLQSRRVASPQKPAHELPEPVQKATEQEAARPRVSVSRRTKRIANSNVLESNRR